MTPELVKTRSHDWLRRHKIEINEWLPVLESATELSPRSASDVAIRALTLSHVIAIGFDAPAARLRESLQSCGLFIHVSESEAELLNKDEHTPQEKINCTWMTECVQSIGWCLGLVKNLDPFNHCDDDLASHFPRPFTDPTTFIARSSLRPFDEIIQQADLHYRLHWAARNARLRQTPCDVQEGLIGERRKALDWVVGVEENWDDIPDCT